MEEETKRSIQEKQKALEAPEKAPEPPAQISIEDFAKVQLKTAKIVAAEPIPKRDKLLKLTVDLGGETRTIVSGIREAYAPESLVGKTVVVVANLKPAKLGGVMSEGMLLAAGHGAEIDLVTLDKPVASGEEIG